MAQLERKMGFGQKIETEGSAMSTLDYELSSLDETDLKSAFAQDDAMLLGGRQHRLEGHGQRGVGSTTKLLLWFLLIVHMSGLLIWFRVWMRDRRAKSARSDKLTPPPQRQSCTYDVDNRLISKLELPMKALKLARA
jgi:hypothetical protein